MDEGENGEGIVEGENGDSDGGIVSSFDQGSMFFNIDQGFILELENEECYYILCERAIE